MGPTRRLECLLPAGIGRAAGLAGWRAVARELEYLSVPKAYLREELWGLLED